jgi:hypothetical protein
VMPGRMIAQHMFEVAEAGNYCTAVHLELPF